MKFSAAKETFIFAVIALMFGLAAWQWTGVPDQVPVHWNWQGQPDALGPRAQGLLGLPFLALIVQLIVLAVPRFDPRHKNYAHFSGAYDTIRFNLLGFFLALYGVYLYSFHDPTLDAGRLYAALTGAFIVVMSSVLSRLRSNWFFGVRTPWTLSSRQSWEKTHRLAGKIFLAVGLVSIAGAGLGAGMAYALLFAGALTGAAVCIIYSYLIWKADPKKDKAH